MCFIVLPAAQTHCGPLMFRKPIDLHDRIFPKGDQQDIGKSEVPWHRFLGPPPKKMDGFRQPPSTHLFPDPGSQAPIPDNHPLNFRERTKNLGGGEDRLEILCRPDISRKHHTKTVRNLAPFRCVVLQTHRAIELLYAVGKIMNPFCIYPHPLYGLKKTSRLHQNLITTLIDESDQSLYNPQDPLGGPWPSAGQT